MNEQSAVSRYSHLALSCALIMLVVSGVWAGSAPHAAASVGLVYFKATPSGNSILLEWETATEQDTVAFNLYRSQDSSTKGQKIGDTFPAQGSGVGGAVYSYPDTDIVSGVRYYYSLEEIASGGGSLTIIATVNAGIDVPTLTPTATATIAPATASATATTVQLGATLTRTPTRTTTVEVQSASQPTATRRFTNTPRPTGTVTAQPLTTPRPAAQATAPPIGSGVVSTPTGGPQRPSTTAPVGVAGQATATALPPAGPTVPSPSPSPAIVSTSAVQPALALDLTPAATLPPQVFAAATSQPLLGTSGRGATPTASASNGETARNTGTILFLGGGAIALAVALGGGILLLLRSRQQ